MDYSIISYIAGAAIIIAGFFIMRNAYKLQEKNYPLEAGEKILYEEEKIKVVVQSLDGEILHSALARITDRRIYIFSKPPYLYSIIYFSEPPADTIKKEFKGILYIPREDFKMGGQDKKTGLSVVAATRKNILGKTVEYTFRFKESDRAMEAIQRK